MTVWRMNTWTSRRHYPCFASALVLIVIGLSAIPSAYAHLAPENDGQAQEEGPPSAIEIARSLIRAERWEAAHSVLVKFGISPVGPTITNKEDDAERQESIIDGEALMGVVDLHFKRYPQTILRLQHVLKSRPTMTALWIYLAQALYAEDLYAEALTALDRGSSMSAKLPGYHILKERCEIGVERYEQAWTSLNTGLATFPDDTDLLREAMLFLVDRNMYEAAAGRARELVEKLGDSRNPDPFILIGEAMLRSRRFADAAKLLEEFRARFPEDHRITALLAYALSGDGRNLSAARLFEGLTYRGHDFAFESADAYRMASKTRDALRMNAAVPDRKKADPQREAILQEGGRHSRTQPLSGHGR